MHQLKSIRRLLLGGALAGAALGAAPALAGAQGIPDSTCVYHDDTHVVTVTDKSGPLQLRLLVDQFDIGVQNPFGTIVRCRSLDGTITANILNTDSINVSGTLVGIADGYVIDEQHGGALTPGFTKEADGFSEIEVNFATRGVPTALDIQGTDTTASGITDTIRFGRIPGALNGVNYGPDNDVDYKIQAGATRFTASGNGGNDIISATGNPDQSTLAPTTVPVTFSGGDGDDVLAGGQDVDRLVGGAGNDFFLSDGDGQVDKLIGQSGFDEALMDAFDSTDSIERQDVLAAAR
jgi:RTX calcium-binding nonapeptide repeat (4 copies)